MWELMSFKWVVLSFFVISSPEFSKSPVFWIILLGSRSSGSVFSWHLLTPAFLLFTLQLCFLNYVSIFYGCHNKLSQTEEFKTLPIYYLTVSRSQKSGQNVAWLGLCWEPHWAKVKVLTEDLGKNLPLSSFWLVAESSFCRCRVKTPVSLLAVSQGLISTPRSFPYSFPCFLWAPRGLSQVVCLLQAPTVQTLLYLKSLTQSFAFFCN